MKKTALLFIVFLALSLTACREASEEGKLVLPEPQTRLITDMAGRQVEIPQKIEKVYSTGQPGVIALYAINPELLLGWCLKPAKEEAEYINSKYLGLPVLGLMQGSNATANSEEIMLRSPDIILMMTYIDQVAILDAEAFQKRMGIPVVLADYALTRIPEAFRFLGDILSHSERAELLARYSENVLADAQKQSALIPEEERLNVYYAQGANGLQTAPGASPHSEVINYVGGKNVVTLAEESDGRLTVNMEQILSWNPDIVIASYTMAHGTVKGDNSMFDIISSGRETWNLVSAVQNNMVFSTPCYPYNWLDMPPGVNRIIGIMWMGNLLYPDYFSLDIREETRTFYRLFYNKTLTDEQMDTLLAGAVKNS
ncbi:MAG: ABC transporter substrate-binding protein [Firmicutes bacterium]|nr:ABC transporter substrate-binding protein [Bacillota bacterium]